MLVSYLWNIKTMSVEEEWFHWSSPGLISGNEQSKEKRGACTEKNDIKK